MPPRVREVKRMLIDAGFVFAREGKGDHTYWEHPSGAKYALDGAESTEMAKGSWFKLRKLLASVKGDV